MGWLEFILGLINALAWPITAFIAALLAYKILKEKLPKINRMKWGNFDIGIDEITSTLTGSLQDKKDKVSNYLIALEDRSKASKYYAINDGIAIMQTRIRELASLCNIDSDSLNKLSNKLHQAKKISDIEFKQFIRIMEMFQDIMRHQEVEDISDKRLRHYLYGCAASASLLDDIIEETKKSINK